MIDFASVVSSLLPFHEQNINATFKALAKPVDESGPFAAIVKDLQPRELFNELFSFLVLRELGLPVPKAYLGLIPIAEGQLKKSPVMPNGQRLAFLTTEVPSPSLKIAAGLQGKPSKHLIDVCLDRVVPLLATWPQLGELYAFDGWIANVDRNLGNILFGRRSSNGSPDIWLIDHGKAFTSEHWSSTHLIPDKSYANKLKNWASPRLSDPQRATCLASASAFKSKADALDREAKIDYLAKLFNLEDTDKHAVKAFLRDRLDKVEENSKDALLMGGIV
ncbi:hypothetical protein [Roseobacter ponti]|uniref:HipA-like C-terminal domain-containing protein n=1 Tax=Roseobacter ponti TaxID=1891787 RepID=A0A858SWF8_9RHOB|nr:hypothetical protein [Roseobacter ponti]QJF51983.1 hypothetical protein G3256_12820 [Roseobacter ponti]